MFAAIFNQRGEPIDVPARRRGAGDVNVKTFGAAGRIAFLWSDGGPAVAAGEDCALHSLDDRCGLVGRVRLDGRGDLQQRLKAKIGKNVGDVSDAALCLHAYAVWGERFIEFLAGDFAFVLWDEARQRLIAVRDQLGVRSLFHARQADTWLASDSLDWIADQTAARGDLDATWIADFLSLGLCRDFERTVYRTIRRLPPAHLLGVDDAGATIRRYWRLDVAEPLHLHHPEDYCEQFRDLVSRAIADRLPRGRIGISLSGGLDSTMLAACTVELVGDPSRIACECEHYEELMHIREDHFAGLAARRLGLDLKIRAFDRLVYDPEWAARGIHSAEPTRSILNAHNLRSLMLDLGQAAPVWFEGEGPDNALSLERNAYLGWLMRQRSWSRLAEALLQYGQVKGIAGWIESFRRRATPAPRIAASASIPRWLDPDFVQRVGLHERIKELGEGGDASHPWHPEAMTNFTSPIWPRYFDNMNFQETLAPVLWRHPFLDLRVLHFMLTAPPIPWGWKKQLMRRAMRGRLPAEVLAREKTPLPCHPELTIMRRAGLPRVSDRRTGAYVDAHQLPTAQSPDSELDAAANVYALDHWLAQGH